MQLREFDKYASLITDEDFNSVQNFLNAEPPNPYEQYCKLIDYYDRLSKNIPLEFYWTSFTDLFEVRRHRVIEHIAAAAAHLKDLLVSRMVADYQQKTRA